MREIWSKQAQVLRIRTYFYELQLNWSFGETSLPFFSMMWTTRELAMMALQNELHTRSTLDRRWTYTRLENRSIPKGGHGNAIRKKLGAYDTPKINASVEDKIEGLKICPSSLERMNEWNASAKCKQWMSAMNSSEEFKWPTILSPHNNKEG